MRVFRNPQSSKNMKTVTIESGTYEVEDCTQIIPGVGIIRRDAAEIGWKGRYSVVMVGKDGEEYDAPVVEETDLD